LRGLQRADLLFLLPALAVVLVQDILWRRGTAVAVALGRFGPLPRLRAWLGRQPPAIALPLFLVPEICSRGGWLVSAWLLLQGEPLEAVMLYGGTKLIAGLSALWIYVACEPALLRVRWFAWCRTIVLDSVTTLRQAVAPSTARPPGRLGRVLAYIRQDGRSAPDGEDRGGRKPGVALPVPPAAP
jgi:hypothetical protein